MPPERRQELVDRFARFKGEILALSVTDDNFGTIPAINRLLDYFKNSQATHLRVAPNMLGLNKIGHFAFFNKRFKDSLWCIPLIWLRDGRIDEDAPGRLTTIPDAPTRSACH
ncbi:MAG: hypothetical protein IPJ38_18310 [Dechloromonas sp.]|uniref:Uncharacterized protein n=1 Tax=Candidatus Dechloromonas phosphorivorans TaxID=2899244 RepID=A0A935JZB0_9RHOO|nr:hypothetical protein [Candidatus Dechloromonas phosphorivorans]